ncbi:MAG: tRNA 2-thiouridine(34) synthase MnmA [Clostridiales bacterium]|nr:tRNA 2-thiouridine(34) synthase MnmA [Clostridiales bacterium]
MAKVLVGMSGGVDSSVAVYLLKEAGYEVYGATMQIQDDYEGCCGSLSSVNDASAVAEQLGIPYFVMNLKDEFRQYVKDKFKSDYLKGLTPNPCILCNHYLKWGSFLKRAEEIGCDYIATGHYGKIVQSGNGRYSVQISDSDSKDQSYVLYSLTQDMLKKTLMPVGNYEKDEIRKIANKLGLKVANKKDSQDICFIPDGDYKSFIRRETGSLGKTGNIVTEDKEIIMPHDGIAGFTVGQRKGLGVALGFKAYVTDIDPESGDVTMGRSESLFSDTAYATNINYMADEVFDPDHIYTVKTRYSQTRVEAKISYVSDDLIRVDFLNAVRAPTPGQALVVYRDDLIAGGGIIVKKKD